MASLKAITTAFALAFGPRIRSAAEKTIVGVLLVAVFAVVVMLITVLVVPTQGPGYCHRAFAAQFPQLAAKTHVFRTTWTRTVGNHWASAIVVQPEDLSQRELTFVCHFQGTNYGPPRLDEYVGDMVDEFKRSSTSNLNPDTWFK